MENKNILKLANEREEALFNTPLTQILDILHLIGQAWQKKSSYPYYQEAYEALLLQNNFSAEMIQMSLDLIPDLLNKETLLERVRSEFYHNEKILDAYTGEFIPHKNYKGKIAAFPLGTILHVTAGNIFLGAIDSLLMGFLTKNISIVKLSQNNQSFPYLFAKSIKDLDKKNIIADKFFLYSWSRHDKETESFFKKGVKAIMAWGGEEMLQSYKQDIPFSTKLIDYGPKISFQVVLELNKDSKDKELARKIAQDVLLWDQSACASPQNLFILTKDAREDSPELRIFLNDIADAIEAHPLKRAPLSDDEQLEIEKEIARAKVHEFVGGSQVLFARSNCTIILDPQKSSSRVLSYQDAHKNLRTSPLNRTLIVKVIKDIDDLCLRLLPLKSYLQSCAWYCRDENRKKELFTKLGRLGIARFSQIGHMLEAKTGAPHDGRFGLTELVRIISSESEEDFQQEAKAEVPFYSQHADTIFINSKMLSEYPLSKNHDLLNSRYANNGHIFSSGGTTGTPKYSFYTYEEFEKVGEMLGKAFLGLGLQAGDLCANFFAAGNMWSSFLAIEKALEHCQTIQLPIGMASPENACELLKSFKPRAIFGLPSILVSYADYAKKNHLNINIPKIFYAGEHLHSGAKTFLSSVFQTQDFHSAGYASVDAGPIAYQCLHCEGSKHHLFAKEIDLKIHTSGEGVITSKFRRAMPIINYLIGDHLTLLPDEVCPCGSPDPLFILNGRIDGGINMWSCKFGLKEIEKGLESCAIQASNFQVVLKSHEHQEYLELRLETEQFSLSTHDVAKSLYESCSDINKTLDFESFKNNFQLNLLPIGGLSRLERTGKTPLLIDLRI